MEPDLIENTTLSENINDEADKDNIESEIEAKLLRSGATIEELDEAQLVNSTIDGNHDADPSHCLACGESLTSLSLLVCLECLGEKCNFFEKLMATE